MKKIFTLLAAGFFAATAMAFTPRPAKANLHFQPGTYERVQAIHQSNFQAIQNNDPRVKRVTDKDGNEWQVMMCMPQGWWSAIGSNDPADFPFYDLMVTASTEINKTAQDFQLEIEWPCVCALDDECVNPNYGKVENAPFILSDVARQKYGERAFDPMTYEEFQQAMTQEDGSIASLLIQVPTLYLQPVIIGPECYGPDAGTDNTKSVTIGSATYWSVSAIDNNGQIDYTNATTLNWTSLDIDASEIVMDYNVAYTAQAPTQGWPTSWPTQKGKMAGTFDGPAIVLGFADFEWDSYNPNQVHIFNAGRQEYLEGDYTMCYNTEFDPLNYYFLCMCDQGMTYEATAKGQDGSQTTIVAYNDNTLPGPDVEMPAGFENIAPSLIGMPLRAAVGDNMLFSFMATALWAPENSAKPYGLWTMPAPVYEDKMMMNPAEAYKLIYWDRSAAAGTQDGTRFIFNGWYNTPNYEKTFIGIGDKNRGLNFSMNTSLSGSYNVLCSYKGDILYHQTPNAWLTDVVALPAIGDVEADAIALGGNAVKAVTSDAPVVSSQYFDFQGRRLSSEPQNGMYIVRNVKADGTVQAIKVAK